MPDHPHAFKIHYPGNSVEANQRRTGQTFHQLGQCWTNLSITAERSMLTPAITEEEADESKRKNGLNSEQKADKETRNPRHDRMTRTCQRKVTLNNNLPFTAGYSIDVLGMEFTGVCLH